MFTTERYRQKAAEMLSTAARCADPEARRRYMQMGEAWQTLAACTQYFDERAIHPGAEEKQA
jgi:hypothetical protein